MYSVLPSHLLHLVREKTLGQSIEKIVKRLAKEYIKFFNLLPYRPYSANQPSDRLGKPESINYGHCYCFAEDLTKLIPGASWGWGHNFDEKYPGSSSHAFARYQDLFYDSEAPKGVPDWTILPFFIRYMKTYPSARKKASKPAQEILLQQGIEI